MRKQRRAAWCHAVCPGVCNLLLLVLAHVLGWSLPTCPHALGALPCRQLLRHDKALHKVQPPSHLKNLPAYLKDATAVGGKSQVRACPAVPEPLLQFAGGQAACFLLTTFCWLLHVGAL
jgi:hypothetical protein